MIIVNKDIGIEFHPNIQSSFRHKRIYMALIEDILRTAVNYTFIGTNSLKHKYERSENSQILLDALNVSDLAITFIEATESLIVRKIEKTPLGAPWYTMIDITSGGRGWVLTNGGDYRIEEWESGRGKPKSGEDNE